MLSRKFEKLHDENEVVLGKEISNLTRISGPNGCPPVTRKDSACGGDIGGTARVTRQHGPELGLEYGGTSMAFSLRAQPPNEDDPIEPIQGIDFDCLQQYKRTR